MKQLNIFDKYKTPQEWKDRALSHRTGGAYYVRRFSVPALLTAIVLLIGGVYSYKAIMRKSEIPNDEGYISEQWGEHFRATVIESDEKLITVKEEDGSVIRISCSKCEFLDDKNNVTELQPDIGDSVIVVYNGGRMESFPEMLDGNVTIQEIGRLGGSENIITKLGKTYSGEITEMEGDGFAMVSCDDGESYRIFCDEISWVYDENNCLTEFSQFEAGDRISFVYEGDPRADIALAAEGYISVMFVQKTGKENGFFEGCLFNISDASDGAERAVFITSSDEEKLGKILSVWYAEMSSQQKTAVYDMAPEKTYRLECFRDDEIFTAVNIYEDGSYVYAEFWVNEASGGENTAVLKGTLKVDESDEKAETVLGILHGANGEYIAEQLRLNGVYSYTTSDGKLSLTMELNNDRQTGRCVFSMSVSNNTEDESFEFASEDIVFFIENEKEERYKTNYEVGSDVVVKAGSTLKVADAWCEYEFDMGQTAEIRLYDDSEGDRQSVLNGYSDELPPSIRFDIESGSDLMISKALWQNGEYEYLVDNGFMKLTLTYEKNEQAGTIHTSAVLERLNDDEDVVMGYSGVCYACCEKLKEQSEDGETEFENDISWEEKDSQHERQNIEMYGKEKVVLFDSTFDFDGDHALVLRIVTDEGSELFAPEMIVISDSMWDETKNVIGTVEKTEADYIYFAPYSWEEESASSDRFVISLNNVTVLDADGKEITASELNEGDEVIVTYSGEIMEMYPAQLGGVTAVQRDNPYV
ncbi:MAG: hypothetical protein ACI4JA_05365 [Oscillospiraceae bacterium]